MTKKLQPTSSIKHWGVSGYAMLCPALAFESVIVTKPALPNVSYRKTLLNLDLS